MTTAAAALRRAAAVGEFFTLADAPAAPGWAPLRELTRDPSSLDRRLASIRERLARSAAVHPDQIALRVTASLDLMGLAARVLSPALGAASLAGVAVGLDLDATWWRFGPQRLAAGDVRATEVATAQQAADALHAGVVLPVLAPLIAAYGDRHAVSPKVLWGNVASALDGARLVLHAADLPQRVPAGEIVAALLRAQLLAPTVGTARPFRRRTCCLYYRIPGAGVCADCVLSVAPRR